MVSNFFSLCRPKISCNSIRNKNVYDANKDNHCKQRVHNIQLLFNCTSNEYMAVSKVSKLVEEENCFVSTNELLPLDVVNIWIFAFTYKTSFKKMFYISYRMNFRTQYFSGISFLCILRYIFRILMNRKLIFEQVSTLK